MEHCRNDARMVADNPDDDFMKQIVAPKNKSTTTASAQIFCGIAKQEDSSTAQLAGRFFKSPLPSLVHSGLTRRSLSA